jgi:hypothetical protein
MIDREPLQRDPNPGRKPETAVLPNLGARSLERSGWVTMSERELQRVKHELLLGGFWHVGRAGAPTLPRS